MPLNSAGHWMPISRRCPERREPIVWNRSPRLLKSTVRPVPSSGTLALWPRSLYLSSISRRKRFDARRSAGFRRVSSATPHYLARPSKNQWYGRVMCLGYGPSTVRNASAGERVGRGLRRARLQRPSRGRGHRVEWHAPSICRGKKAGAKVSLGPTDHQIARRRESFDRGVCPAEAACRSRYAGSR